MEEKFWLIRGARLVQQLAEEEKKLQQEEQLDEVSSAPELDTNIRSAWPNTRKRHNATGEVTVANIQYIPYIGMKMLHVKASTVSNGHAYNQAIQFQRVFFDPTDTPENATFKASDGEDYHIRPLDLAAHNVKVRCNCLDFHFRFANYNAEDKSLVGKPPPPYQRKTLNRPPVNPDQVPGMCKHLLKVVQTLQQYGLITKNEI